MSRTTVVALIAVLCILPLASSAETVDELQAKINTLMQQIKTLQEKISGAATTNAAAPTAAPAPASSSACPVLVRTLGIGSRGNDVTQLQVFLKAGGYFNEEATGYFGALTEAAVKRLQAAADVVSSGDAQSTGYGAVGPKTRVRIAALCSASASASAAATPVAAPVQCPAITSASAPSTACGGTWEKLMSLGCHIGWRCVLPYAGANKPPLVTSIEGPTTLAPSTFGSWKIQAVDPEQGALTYSITWGDEGFEDILRSIAGIGSAYSAASSATHSYAKAGTYTMSVSVRDSAGNTAAAQLTIKIASDSTNTGNYFNPVGASATTTGAACVTPWGVQVVSSGSTVYWQPFFTEGSYFATTSPIMRCDNGGWKKCDVNGVNCQTYVAATSTPSTAALPSYVNKIGAACPKPGDTMVVSVPPGTQLCQWLSCTITTEVQTITLRCNDNAWVDFK
jgi:peptidoglycan hydrolase-like protein with peptidoglycan-binding domain